LQYKIKGKFDYVICESPPLFLGMSARFISRRKKARLIFNVSDLWPESAVKLNIVTNKFFLRLAYKLEASLYRSSYLVTGQTKGICSDISNRFPDVKTHWLPNGIDPQRFDPSMHTQWREKNNFSADDFILLYAGILGHAQGLECIIKAAAALKDTKAKFVFFGDGPEKKKLTELVSDMKLKNVFFFQPVSRELIPEVIAASNAAVIPLRKLDIFTGAIPSKIFETLAMGKPVILGVEGEAKELFIDKADAGLFFRPEDSDDLTEKIKMLMRDPSLASSKGSNGRRYVLQEFNREAITDKLIKRIEA
jgi:glycosyltransferase involved in cell wall biosynthesis